MVLNWHATEACNYGCRYCYAHWDNAGTGRELGFVVSIITNVSLLTPALAEGLADHLSLLGVSLDSASSTSNREIGCLDRRGRQLTADTLEGCLAAARRINPELRLKINTVVNALNCDEDMMPLIRKLAPEKWKVLRMLPIVTSDLAVSDAQFGTFVQRRSGNGLPLRVEDNADMTESYIMIDPLGRFFHSRMGYQGGFNRSARSPPSRRSRSHRRDICLVIPRRARCDEVFLRQGD